MAKCPQIEQKTNQTANNIHMNDKEKDLTRDGVTKMEVSEQHERQQKDIDGKKNKYTSEETINESDNEYMQVSERIIRNIKRKTTRKAQGLQN